MRDEPGRRPPRTATRPATFEADQAPAPPARGPLASLDLGDETAWLVAMAALGREGRTEEMDLPHLAESLADMAGRDRREVESRMVVLLTHLLEWEHQPERRSRSGRATIIEPRQELHLHASRGVLRNHAEAMLARCNIDAVERNAAETGLKPEAFPPTCPDTLDQLLTMDVREEPEPGG